MSDTLLWNGPERARRRLLLAHGAGAPMDSPFMNAIAEGVAGAGIRVGRFEFPYMAARRDDGKRRGPDRPAVLLDSWRRVIDDCGGGERVAIGGKSMGGRIASMVADDMGVRGVVCLGYPFHPPGRPEKLRTAHLTGLQTPALIVQGERDPFGKPEEVAGYGLSEAIELCWIGDGDHSLKPRKKSGRSEEQNLAEAVDAIVSFVRSR